MSVYAFFVPILRTRHVYCCYMSSKKPPHKHTTIINWSCCCVFESWLQEVSNGAAFETSPPFHLCFDAVSVCFFVVIGGLLGLQNAPLSCFLGAWGFWAILSPISQTSVEIRPSFGGSCRRMLFVFLAFSGIRPTFGGSFRRMLLVFTLIRRIDPPNAVCFRPTFGGSIRRMLFVF